MEKNVRLRAILCSMLVIIAFIIVCSEPAFAVSPGAKAQETHETEGLDPALFFQLNPYLTVRERIFNWLWENPFAHNATGHFWYCGCHDPGVPWEEMTMNAVSLMLGRYEETGNETYLKEAEAAGNWILKQQYLGVDRSAYGGIRDSHFGPDLLNLGNSLGATSLLRLYAATGNRTYLERAVLFADWIVRSSFPNGTGFAHYNLTSGTWLETTPELSGWAPAAFLLKVYEHVKNVTYYEGARAILEQAFSRIDHTTGYVELTDRGYNESFSHWALHWVYHPDYPEGPLIYFYRMFSNETYYEAFFNVLDWFMKAERPSYALYTYYGSDGTPNDTRYDGAATAEFVAGLIRAYEYSDNEKYLNYALNILNFGLLYFQNFVYKKYWGAWCRFVDYYSDAYIPAMFSSIFAYDAFTLAMKYYKWNELLHHAEDVHQNLTYVYTNNYLVIMDEAESYVILNTPGIGGIRLNGVVGEDATGYVYRKDMAVNVVDDILNITFTCRYEGGATANVSRASWMLRLSPLSLELNSTIKVDREWNATRLYAVAFAPHPEGRVARYNGTFLEAKPLHDYVGPAVEFIGFYNRSMRSGMLLIHVWTRYVRSIMVPGYPRNDLIAECVYDLDHEVYSVGQHLIGRFELVFYPEMAYEVESVPSIGQRDWRDIVGDNYYVVTAWDNISRSMVGGVITLGGTTGKDVEVAYQGVVKEFYVNGSLSPYFDGEYGYVLPFNGTITANAISGAPTIPHLILSGPMRRIKVEKCGFDFTRERLAVTIQVPKDSFATISVYVPWVDSNNWILFSNGTVAKNLPVVNHVLTVFFKGGEVVSFSLAHGGYVADDLYFWVSGEVNVKGWSWALSDDRGALSVSVNGIPTGLIYVNATRLITHPGVLARVYVDGEAYQNWEVDRSISLMTIRLLPSIHDVEVTFIDTHPVLLRLGCLIVSLMVALVGFHDRVRKKLGRYWGVLIPVVLMISIFITYTAWQLYQIYHV